MPNVFMFSGQGAQYFQMGRALFERNCVFHDCMLSLDTIVQQMCGKSVIKTLYESGNGISKPFDHIVLTHPAIFMVEYAMARTLVSAGVMPDCLLGVSLGTFSAAAVAGCLEPESALEMVINHALSIESSCPRGGMIAVLGPITLLKEESLEHNCEVAAINSAEHFVISALEANCTEIERALCNRRIAFMRLPVHYAFHSRWVEPARDQFEKSISLLNLKPALPAVFCSQQTARLSDIPNGHFWTVTRKPIRFRESIAVLEADSANRYIDVGPAGSLALLLKYLLPTQATRFIYPIMNPYGRDMENLALVTAQTQARIHKTETRYFL